MFAAQEKQINSIIRKTPGNNSQLTQKGYYRSNFGNANQKYVTVCHTGGEVLVEDALKALEIEFADRFYRIHRNAQVSLSHVSGLKTHNARHQVTFHDIDNTLEVSRRHLARVRGMIENS
jgi:DNA-binding LytR/AlgR family response regulator